MKIEDTDFKLPELLRQNLNTYLGHWQTSVRNVFVKIINDPLLLAVLRKSSIIDVS